MSATMPELVKAAHKALAWDEYWTWLQWIDGSEEAEELRVDLQRGLTDHPSNYSDQYFQMVLRLRTFIDENPEGVAALRARHKAELERSKAEPVALSKCCGTPTHIKESVRSDGAKVVSIVRHFVCDNCGYYCEVSRPETRPLPATKAAPWIVPSASARARFEKWISAQPDYLPGYLALHRWPLGNKYQGQYGDHAVQLAWEAWQEAWQQSWQKATSTEKGSQ